MTRECHIYIYMQGELLKQKAAAEALDAAEKEHQARERTKKASDDTARANAVLLEFKDREMEREAAAERSRLAYAEEQERKVAEKKRREAAREAEKEARRKAMVRRRRTCVCMCLSLAERSSPNRQSHKPSGCQPRTCA